MTESPDLTVQEDERRAVARVSPLSVRLIFESIRRHGEEELERPIASLWWSGVAAGLLISFSVLGESILRANLPDTQWRYLIENFGYSAGFILVILGRMQLFTENTITTVVPAVLQHSRHAFLRTARLWVVVLFANVVGAFLIATFFAKAPVLSPAVFEAMVELSHHATGLTASEGFFRGIPAGVLIAALVWMMPSAQSSQVALIVFFTWMIAAGDFTHIVAGSVEMAFLMVQGELAAGPALTSFFLPVLAGNVAGGTVVFTLLTYAQIKHELPDDL